MVVVVVENSKICVEMQQKVAKTPIAPQLTMHSA